MVWGKSWKGPPSSRMGKDFTNFPPSQYMMQDHFIVRCYTQIETHAWALPKNSWSCWHSPIGMPQSQSNKLNCANQVLLGGKAP